MEAAAEELENGIERFFAPPPVDPEKTRDFRDRSESDLIDLLRNRMQAAFPEARIGSEKSSREFTDIVAEFPAPFAITIAIEVKRNLPPESAYSYIEQIRELFLRVEEEPEGNDQFYLLLAADLTDEKEAKHAEKAMPVLGKALAEFGVTLVPPQQAWPLIFEEVPAAAKAARQRPAKKAVKKKRPEKEKPAPKPQAAAIHMLSDAAIESAKADRLGFGPYAEAIAGLIDDPSTKTPLTLAINARWGVGKSSLAHMVDERLKSKPEGVEEKPHVTYWFDAWMHDDAGDLGAAFMADIVRGAHRLRPWWRQLFQPLPLALADAKERRWRRIRLGFVLFLMVLGLAALWFRIQQPGVINEVAATGAVGSALFTTALTILRYLGQATKAVGEFVASPGAAADTGSLQMVREQLRSLIRQVTPPGSKFVVLIDDLERCRPPTAIDVLEVVSQLLSYRPVVVVIIADMPAIATCAEIKYEKLAERYNPATTVQKLEGQGSEAYGRLFLQKFIQLQFDLPEQSPARIQKLINKLVEEQERQPPAAPARKDLFLRIGESLRRYYRPIADSIRRSALAAWESPMTTDELFAAGIRDVPYSVRGSTLFFSLFFLPVFWTQRFALSFAQVPSLHRTKTLGARLTRLLVFLLGLSATALTWPGLVISPVSLFTKLPLDLLEITVALLIPAFLLLSFVGVIVGRKGVRQRRRDTERLRAGRVHIDEFIEEHGVDETPPLPTDIEIDLGLWKSLVVERQQRHLGTDSELFQEARIQAFKYLLPVPRNAKRLVNRLRLLLFILHGQEALGGRPRLGPKHLGKWVALQERWPQLAQVIAKTPDEMAKLEAAPPAGGNPREKSEAEEGAKAGAAAAETIVDHLNRLTPPYAEDVALHAFFKDRPALGPTIRRLVSFGAEA